MEWLPILAALSGLSGVAALISILTVYRRAGQTVDVQQDDSESKRFEVISAGQERLRLALLARLDELEQDNTHLKAEVASLTDQMIALRAEHAALMGPLDGLRVLVIDDDAAIRETLQLLLETEGAVVHTLGQASAIVPHVEAWKPDRILLDWLMSPVNGAAVLEALRAAHLVPAVPVLVLSGYLPTGDRVRQTRELQHLGARTYIPKLWEDWTTVVQTIAHPPAVWPGVP